MRHKPEAEIWGTFDLKPWNLSFIRILIDLNTQNSSRSNGQGHRSMPLLRELWLLQKLRDVHDQTGVCLFWMTVALYLIFFLPLRKINKANSSCPVSLVLLIFIYIKHTLVWPRSPRFTWTRDAKDKNNNAARKHCIRNELARSTKMFTASSTSK